MIFYRNIHEREHRLFILVSKLLGKDWTETEVRPWSFSMEIQLERRDYHLDLPSVYSPTNPSLRTPYGIQTTKARGVPFRKLS